MPMLICIISPSSIVSGSSPHSIKFLGPNNLRQQSIAELHYFQKFPNHYKFGKVPKILQTVHHDLHVPSLILS